MPKRQKFLLSLFILFALTLGIALFRSPKLSAQQLSCKAASFTGEVDSTLTSAVFDGKSLPVPQIAFTDSETNVLGESNSSKWVEVDLSEQKLRAWEGDKLVTETLVSTGLPWWPTPTGEFRIWIKLRAAKMEGGQGRYYYNLPNVPYVMFFENAQVPGYKGYGLHGTYWHNSFGTQRSHGCVNLPTEMAEILYNWTDPQLPPGKSVVYATADNPGTRIVIHE